jgi:hypothetical protein
MLYFDIKSVHCRFSLQSKKKILIRNSQKTNEGELKTIFWTKEKTIAQIAIS